MTQGDPYPYAPDAVLPPELAPVLEPADAGAGAARGWAAEFDRVPRRDSIKLLVHAVWVSPVWCWGEIADIAGCGSRLWVGAAPSCSPHGSTYLCAHRWAPRCGLRGDHPHCCLHHHHPMPASLQEKVSHEACPCLQDGEIGWCSPQCCSGPSPTTEMVRLRRTSPEPRARHT